MKSLHQGRDSTLGNIHGDIIHGEKCVVKKVALEKAVTFTVSLEQRPTWQNTEREENKQVFPRCAPHQSAEWS
ncbi:hypothetical protein CapIbe_022011 [Capra ibex]